MLFQGDDPMRWHSFIPRKVPLQVVVPADGLKWIDDDMCHKSGDAMLKFIGEAIKSEAANGYSSQATSSPFVPKRKRKLTR
jgi:hypothetical protein